MTDWADSRAQPYADQRDLWDTVAHLLGESRDRDGAPVSAVITEGGQTFTVTIEARMPPNLSEQRGHDGRLF
jgi:hypothetical protein